MKKQIVFITGVVFSMAIGSVLAGPIPVGDSKPVETVECTNCHSEDPDLCATRTCPEGSVCVGIEGAFDNGGLWVDVICMPSPV